jgi:UDP-2,3-diacylglucosamine pyrophosphatase LpxH
MMMGIAAYEELGMTERPPARVNQGDDEFPTPIDALIISDLHLGSESCQAKSLVAFFQEILDGRLSARRLIINGDVFDSIDFRRLRKNHWKVLSQIRHLSDKLEIIWICGNHDGPAEIVSHLLGVRVEEQYLLASGGRSFLIVHGHQFDGFINDHPVLTWLADKAYGLLQKLDRTHYVARLAKRRSKTFIRCSSKIRLGAQQLAARTGADAAICGHTHHAAQEEQGTPASYYNSGCWTESPSTYLAVHDGAVRLHTWNGVLAV